MLESSQRIEQLAELFRRRQEPLSDPGPPVALPASVKQANCCTQIFMLLLRALIYTQPLSLIHWCTQLLLAAVMSVILGAIFFDLPNTDSQLLLGDRQGFHYAVACVAMWPILLQLSLGNVRRERWPVHRDIRDHLYSRLVYIVTKVEPGTCMQRLMGNVKTGIILKDVSLEVHGGEVLAVLGSKGSGKRALLEVISRRAQGPTRGQILLNGMPMSLRLFQQSCGYVTHKCDLLPGITVEQTLYYAAQLTIGSKTCEFEVFDNAVSEDSLAITKLVYQFKQLQNVKCGELVINLSNFTSGQLQILNKGIKFATQSNIFKNHLDILKVNHEYSLSDDTLTKHLVAHEPKMISHYVKASRVKQVMADLALTQVANRGTQYLTPSEYRRLMIGVQLVRDPILLLLDEPTWDLDPLNTYLIISILSNHARKYGRIVVLTMEKPRSDVFPFLDRVMYLCLGDVVYTGGTRLMLDYFRGIGFPCPELENPLMYYLCLSTVDRRSRERFIESNHQIAALVEKFKIEGGPFRKSSSSTYGNVVPDGPDIVHGGVTANPNKVPLSTFGRPGCLHVAFMLYMRCLATTFNLKKTGVSCLALRMLALPIFHFLLWIFYSGMQVSAVALVMIIWDYQRTFITRNGLIFNCIAGAYVVSIIVTACTFPPHRTRYYQEAQEGLYSGPLFLLCYLLYSLPFSAISVAAASRITFELIGVKAVSEWLLFGGILWACYLLAEQQTIAILMTVCSSFRAAVCSIYISTVYLILGSGILRSFHGLPDWLLYLTYATQSRYAGAFLSQQMFTKDGLLSNLPYDANVNCTSFFLSQTSPQASSSSFVCRYANGMAFLSERYGKKDGVDTLAEILDRDLNFGVVYAFTVGLIIINSLLYLIPLPAFVKAKFRE